MSPIQDPPRPPLTDTERAWLTDKAAFARAAAQGPLVLRNRTVENLEITDLALAGVTFEGVDFAQTQFARVKLANSRLRDVVFVACRFEEVAWSHCRFARCALEMAELETLRLSDCTAEGLTFSMCEGSGVAVSNCELRDFTQEQCSYKQADWKKVRLNAPSLNAVSYVESKLADITMLGGSLANVSFTECEGRGLLVQGATLDRVEFVFGTWVAVTFDDVYGRCLGFGDVQATGISLLGARMFVSLGFSGGRVAGLAVDRCPELRMFNLFHAKVRGLLVSHSSISGVYWKNSTISHGSSISNSRLGGLQIIGSTIDGVEFRDTEMATRLELNKAHIRGLVLERIRYTPGLVLADDGVEYGPGARFPKP